MIKIINPTYTLENVLFSNVMEVAIYLSAPSFEMRCKGNVMSEHFLGESSAHENFWIEPSKERLKGLDFNCLLINNNREEFDYEVNITFRQGIVPCGIIHKTGKIKKLQKIRFQYLIWFPFD